MKVDWNALKLNSESLAQTSIDVICDLQADWPMPAENWNQFVKDVEHTNKKRGWNLEIRRDEP